MTIIRNMAFDVSLHSLVNSSPTGRVWNCSSTQYSFFEFTHTRNIYKKIILKDSKALKIIF